jgi:hypothetical protein
MRRVQRRGECLTEILVWNLPGGTENNHENVGEDIRFPGRHSRRLSPEWKRWSRTAWPLASLTGELFECPLNPQDETRNLASAIRENGRDSLWRRDEEGVSQDTCLQNLRRFGLLSADHHIGVLFRTVIGFLSRVPKVGCKSLEVPSWTPEIFITQLRGG